MILAGIVAAIGGGYYHVQAKTERLRSVNKKIVEQKSLENAEMESVIKLKNRSSRLTLQEEFLIRAIMPTALVVGVMLGTVAAIDTAAVASLGLNLHIEAIIYAAIGTASIVPAMVISDKAAKAYENYKSQEPF